MNPVHSARNPIPEALALVDPATVAPARYLSCRFIERGITIFPGSVAACGANPATGMTPLLAPFKDHLSAQALMEGRSRIIERHKRGDIVPECKGCPRLMEWGPEHVGPYAIDEVSIAYFSSCNIRCNYCYTVTSPHLTAPLSRAPRILPVFQDLIDQKLLAPDATVRFSGGEPTLSVEFEPLLRLLTEYGARCIVATNATKRSDAIMEALARDKVELVLGIDAASAEVYKSIKKMNYNEKVWKVVSEYCAAIPPGAANKVWAKFIFCVENFHEAEHFVRRAEAAGAKNVYYDFDASRVRPGDERGGVGLPEDVTDYVAVLRHECMKRGIEVDFAQSGLVWLTPERTARIEHALDRLTRAEEIATGSSLILLLRHQLNIALRRVPARVRLLEGDALSAGMTRIWSALRDMSQAVQPTTMMRWHQSALRSFKSWLFGNKEWQPKIDHGLRDLIGRMSRGKPLWWPPEPKRTV